MDLEQIPKCHFRTQTNRVCRSKHAGLQKWRSVRRFSAEHVPFGFQRWSEKGLKVRVINLSVMFKWDMHGMPWILSKTLSYERIVAMCGWIIGHALWVVYPRWMSNPCLVVFLWLQKTCVLRHFYEKRNAGMPWTSVLYWGGATWQLWHNLAARKQHLESIKKNCIKAVQYLSILRKHVFAAFFPWSVHWRLSSFLRDSSLTRGFSQLKKTQKLRGFMSILLFIGIIIFHCGSPIDPSSIHFGPGPRVSIPKKDHDIMRHISSNWTWSMDWF